MTTEKKPIAKEQEQSEEVATPSPEEGTCADTKKYCRLTKASSILNS